MMDDKYVLFEVNGTTYGVPSVLVAHVEMVDHVTVVPNANAAVDGVVFSRGQVIPALNLRSRFGFPRQPDTIQTRLLFVRTEGRLVGLVVDAAREFVSIPPGAIRPIAQTLTGISGNYLHGVAQLGERLILLIDLEAVLDLKECATAVLGPEAAALGGIQSEPALRDEETKV